MDRMTTATCSVRRSNCTARECGASWLTAIGLRANAPLNFSIAVKRVRRLHYWNRSNVCEAVEQGLCNGRESVSPSFACRTSRLRVCFCAPSRQEISIDCCTAGAQQQWRRSMAQCSKRKQCHVDNRSRLWICCTTCSCSCAAVDKISIDRGIISCYNSLCYRTTYTSRSVGL